MIRHIEESDCEQVHQLYANLQVYCNTLQLPYPSLETWVKRITNLPEGVSVWLPVLMGKLWAR